MANVASSSQAPIAKRPPGVVQLNDSVWELYNPSSIGMVPEIDILFFHGLQLGDYKEAFWRTWLSRDNTVLWPRDWLSERLPKARILSISYDSLARKHPGQSDLYVITENLIQDMIQSENVHVGQNCPVVLVGHSFGGIVIKTFVLKCVTMKAELNSKTCQLQVRRINNFLRNCRGVFYYSTPNGGSRIADYADLIPGINVPLMNLLKTLSTETGRINWSFASARRNWGIRASAIVESLNTSYKGLSAKVVEEASARNDIDDMFYTAPEANHFDVCKPKDKTTCAIFKYLVTFVGDIQSDRTTVGDDGDKRPGLPQYPIELESRARDIKRLLLGKAVIGISGMGGIGKTTVAKEVYNDLSKQYEYTCFAENVKGKQIGELEDWLLRHFHESRSRMDGKQRQWSDFKGKKTMIVLDDVDCENQLSVLPTLDHFGKGSCIVLTSRDIDIFKFYDDYELYQVTFLNDDDAKKLFCQHAFGSQDIPSYRSERKHLRKPVEAVVKKCGGLPLTLEVMGRYLRNKVDANVWEQTIDKLKEAESINGKQNDRVWASLSVSYEALVKEEQEMFIEAGTCFFGRPLDEALAAWSSISAHSKSRWENLVNRSMVKEGEKKTVWVHEHLRDLAWSLTKDNVVSGSNAKADELVDQLNSKQVNSKTKILQLHHSPNFRNFHRSERTLQVERVADLKELKYLDLRNVSSKGSCKNLARTLILLKWNLRGRLMSPFPMTLIPMTNLAVLEVVECSVPGGFSEALGNLTNLRCLSLTYLAGLDHLPDNFGNLSRLIFLDLVALRLPSLPKSFGDLLALEHLKLVDLEVCELPESFGYLSRLIYLSLNGLRLPSLPRSFGNLSALEHLELENLDVCELPESFGNLSSLVDLRIYSCEKLASLRSSFGHHLTSLNELAIMSCPLLECLPESLSGLSSLRKLDILHCSGLKELGDSFGSLGALEDLHLKLTRVEKLPHSFSQLSGLQRLQLRGCTSLKELGDSFGNLSALKYIDLENTRIGGLPESFGCLSALEELKLEFDQARLLPDNFCLLTALRVLSIKSASLESLPESLGELARLEELSLETNNVNALPTSLGTLAALRNLHIRSEKLEKLPDSFVQLRSLRELEVRAKTSVGILNSIGPLSSLQSLDVREIKKSGEHKLDCDDSVGKLADSFGKLSSLEMLKLQCRGLESLPNSVGKLSSLKTMDVDCGDLKELPESLAMLSSLETLKIVARKLERLPQGIGRLHSLRTMKLEVPSIRFLPESINQLSSLRKFSFNCDGHDRMPDHFEHLPFPSLSLVLKGSASVPEGIGKLCSLQDLTLDFRSVQSLPEELGELSSLQKLKISCGRLKSLPDSLGRLSSLRKLSLWGCWTLRRLPESMRRPSSSQGELPHRTVRSDAESFSQTTAAGANALKLTVSVLHCSCLQELTMRWLGWVAYKEDEYSGALHYRRKRSDNVPLGRVVQLIRVLCYMAISVYVLRKLYSAFESK